ncbi:MAG: pectinesterase family protein [Paludibacteraceae bacterium]|nr:pectinesterase family protein [Paludibacteraceae bacterium]
MKRFLLKQGLLILLLSWFTASLSAQGTYGNTLLFNSTYTSSWTTTGTTFSVVAGIDTVTVAGTASASISSSRSKAFATRNNTTAITSVNYTGAAKCTSVTVSKLPSLGQINLAVQNGAGTGGTTALIKTQISSNKGVTWTTVDSISLVGNANTIVTPANVVSKDSIQVRFLFPYACWFYGVSAYNHISENNTAAPALLSASPVASSNLSASGAITLVFDELVKAGTGTVSLGNATISSIKYLGNTVVINYTGFTNATNPLVVPAAAITNYYGTALASDISIAYQIDVTPPTLQSVSPTQGSTIHINDLGQTARKIALTFSEPIQLGTGTLSFNGATLTPSVSGNVLTIGYSGLKYNTTDTLKIPKTYIQDLSGNALAKDTAIVYYSDSRDTTPPLLRTQSVAGGATAQPIGGSIYLTFNEILKVGSVPVTINGNPVVVSTNDSIIGLNYTNLPYNTAVTVSLPAGCVTDTCGNAFAGTSFIINTTAKVAKAFDFVVAKDGTGDYTTVQAAINAAPNNSATRTLIYIKNGIYKEKVTIPVRKTKISLIGENVDKTIITWKECSSTATDSTGASAGGTDNSYSVVVFSDDFYAENITIRNDYDYHNGTDANKQSVAFEHQGDKHVMKNCKFYSFQDTYYPKKADKRQYLLNCSFQGGTDFIFGSGTAFFDTCSIRPVRGGQFLTAPSAVTKKFGFVFNNCTVSRADTTIWGTSASDTIKLFYLGRPWGDNTRSVYINAKMDSALIQPTGWSIWGATDTYYTTAYFAEYNSRSAGGSLMPTASRVSWSNQLTSTQAAQYTFDNAFNFGLSGTWNPRPYLTAPSAPTNPTVSGAGVISWTESPFGVGYLVFRNDSLIGKTAGTTYTDGAYKSTAVYTVKASNEYGALSVKSAQAVLTGINNVKANAGFLVATVVSSEITLSNPSNFSSVEVVSITGKKVISTVVNGSSVNVEALPVGIYLAKGYAKNGDVYIDKIVKK